MLTTHQRKPVNRLIMARIADSKPAMLHRSVFPAIDMGNRALNAIRPLMKPGKNGTLTHDDKRHGTAILFAALNVHAGTVIAECLSKHRNEEFLRFLEKLDGQTDQALSVHVIVDNYATPRGPT